MYQILPAYKTRVQNCATEQKFADKANNLVYFRLKKVIFWHFARAGPVRALVPAHQTRAGPILCVDYARSLRKLPNKRESSSP